MVALDHKTKASLEKLLGPDKSRLIVFYCGFVKCISVEFALDLLYEEGTRNRVLPGAPR